MSRRNILLAGAGCASACLVASRVVRAETDEHALALIKRLTGKAAEPSDRVRLSMPKVFPNGYTVPFAFDIDSAMTEADHAKYVRVLAPKNPLIEVATFHFTPGRSRATATTRIRLAEPQFVVAFAEMNDGRLLMAKAWVDVATNGCK